MLQSVKGGSLPLDGTQVHYVRIGKRGKPLVIIPGLGEAMKSLKGQAFILSAYYRAYAKEFCVYIIGRKEVLPHNCSIRDMAEDLKASMEALGLESASLMGISQGGMIAQEFAINYPEMTEKLAICISISRPSQTITSVVGAWIDMALMGDYKSIAYDSMEKTYTPKKFKKYKIFMPLIQHLSKLDNFDRFIVQAKACISHNCYERLHLISCPVLVIGGGNDKITGPGTNEEIAERIKNCKLIIYDDLGHGAYDETKDFDKQVRRFLK